MVKVPSLDPTQRIVGASGVRAERDDLDGIGDEKSGQQADPELPQEVAPRHREVVALRRTADHREQVAHAVGGESDAVVADDQRIRPPRRLDLDEALDVVAELGPGGDGVAGVLHQLAQIHAFAAVEVVPDDVDDAAKVDPELLTHAPSPPPRKPLPLARRRSLWQRVTVRVVRSGDYSFAEG